MIFQKETAAFEIKDPNLAVEGDKIIESTKRKMPILNLISLRLSKSRVFEGARIAICLHATAETSCLALALKEGGAEVYLASSSPSSINDAAMASLALHHGIHVYADSSKAIENNNEYWDALTGSLPHIIADDGATFIQYMLRNNKKALANVIGSTEQTTSGVYAVRALEKADKLPFPVICVNESKSKHMFDNQFGVAQSFIDACNALDFGMLCGKTIVICGFGWCGQGVAKAALGMGANVIVTEIDPIKAAEAHMLGYRVMPILEAAKFGNVFATFTGSTKVITYEAMLGMKNGAVLINGGSGTTEIDVDTLKKRAQASVKVNENLTSYTLENGKQIKIACDGRVANLACVGGNASEIMDLSFSIHATALEHLMCNHGEMSNKAYTLPEEIDKSIALLKLMSYGIEIDRQTPEQIEHANRLAHFVE